MSNNTNYSEAPQRSKSSSSNGGDNKDVLDQWQLWKNSVNDIASSDLHDLAHKLDIKLGEGQSKTGGDRVYHSPSHKDKSPSLSIFKNGSAWKDHSSNVGGGDAISLYRYNFDGMSFKDAVNGLASLYNVPAFKPVASGNPVKEKSLAQFIADRVLKGDKNKATEYLKGRGISNAVIEKGIASKSIGWNDYTNPKHPVGESGHGGEGVSFIAKDRYDLTPVAVDTRYENPEHNGDIKTNSQGDKDGAPWVLDWPSFKRAATVYICESAINVLSVLTVMPDEVSAIATRGTATIDSLPSDIFKGKMVYICMDNDAAFDKDHQLAGKRPGPEAGWALYDKLSAAGIACMMIDQTLDERDGWQLGDDVNDLLQRFDRFHVKTLLNKAETAIIQGLQSDGEGIAYEGNKRAFLPPHDYTQYWRFKVEPNFTRYVADYKVDNESDSGKSDIKTEDLCAFRVSHVGRVAIQSWQATVLNASEGQGETLFSVACQTPQEGNKLERRTFSGEQFANPQNWGKFGYIFKPAQFMRMTNILTNTMDRKETLAINFVGVAYKNGKPVVSEGGDCYFKDPEIQCPYHDLIFNSGTTHHAKQVVDAFQSTFTDNAAMMPVVWALGSHLKAFLGFWPHMQMQAEKASGKSELMNKMARALQMTIFGKAQLESAFKLQKTVSYTGHPVMWEEVGTANPVVLKEADSKLQECYNYRFNTRGYTNYLSAAPVLMGGEEVAMDSLQGKMVRTSISVEKQGDRVPNTLPVFPMRQWLEFLTKLDRERVENALSKCTDICMNSAVSDKEDANAKRSIGNFAAIMLSWRLLCEFTGIDRSQGDFERDLIREMNLYLKDTQASRHPWVGIMEIALSEIDAGRWQYPMAVREIVDNQGVRTKCLLVRHTHIMDHMKHSSHLKDRFHAMPIKQAKSFFGQVEASGVIAGVKKESRDRQNRRVTGMTAFSLEKLASFGLELARDHESQNVVPGNVIPEGDVPWEEK